MNDYKVFEWPDRESARQMWHQNSRDKGGGCFLFDTSKDRDKNHAVLITAGPPIWATRADLKGLPTLLYKTTRQAIRDAGLRADTAIMVILNYPIFQIVKIPFDPNQKCQLIFEATVNE